MAEVAGRHSLPRCAPRVAGTGLGAFPDADTSGRQLPRSPTRCESPSHTLHHRPPLAVLLLCSCSLHCSSTSSPVLSPLSDCILQRRSYGAVPGSSKLRRRTPRTRTQQICSEGAIHGAVSCTRPDAGPGRFTRVASHTPQASLHQADSSAPGLLAPTLARPGWLDRLRPEDSALASRDPHAPLSNSFKFKTRTSNRHRRRPQQARTASQSLLQQPFQHSGGWRSRNAGARVLRWHWAALKHARCTST